MLTVFGNSWRTCDGVKRVPRLLVIGLLAMSVNASAASPDVLEIGSRRELFVDHSLIERLHGLRLELGRPQSAGVAVTYDKPWEGPLSFYSTVVKDGDTYRMYYRGKSSRPGFRFTICYAESRDAIHWTKPELGLIELDGSKANNVVLLENQVLVPFLDTRPGVPAHERYKGNAFVETRFGAKQPGLLGYVSPDGVNWKPIRPGPIVPSEFKNNFDSQNVMFWSEVEQQYVLYARQTEAGFRAQSRATSKDFLTWTPQVLMTYSDTGTTVPSEQLYTSQVQPYFRAPHIYISLPGRLMEGRRALTAEQARKLGVDPLSGGEADCSDGVVQTTRAGSTRFDRTFREAFVRPGSGDANWVSRTNYPACGIVQTGPAEMSFFVQRHYGQKTAHLERYALRLDGFASVHAPLAGGELLTRPLKFTGDVLELNCATSAAGGIRVEIQHVDGKPLSGFSLADCDEIHADDIARVVTWKGSGDLSKLAGQPVRLRFQLRDADLYAIQFKQIVSPIIRANGVRTDDEQPRDNDGFSEHLLKDGYSYSYGLATADLDGDGDLDLTSSDTRNFKLYWFENDGHGKFTHHLIEDGDRLHILGDITGDAITKSVTGDETNNRWFKTPRLERHAIGDINADGKPDVVIVENLHGDVYWYKNSGTPAKDPLWRRFRITTQTIPGAYDVALADLDADGDQDVAVSTWRLSNKFVWFENPGDPEKSESWKRHVIEENIAEPRTIRVGDFNGDGKPDLLGTARVANLVVWYENPGDPRSKSWVRHVIDSKSPDPGHGMPADLDNDGDLDVVMALGMDSHTKETGTREIVWYENVGVRAIGIEWKKHVIGADFDDAAEAIAVDLDGDGHLDVAATSYAAPHGRAVWFQNPGDPRHAWKLHNLKTNWPRANQIIASDLDSDGKPDLVAGATGSVSEVRWWRNQHHSRETKLKNR